MDETLKPDGMEYKVITMPIGYQETQDLSVPEGDGWYHISSSVSSSIVMVDYRQTIVNVLAMVWGRRVQG